MMHSDTGAVEGPSDSGLLLAIWRRLAPVLRDNAMRVGLALTCLVAAKAGLLIIPCLLKALVDGLEEGVSAAPVSWILVLVLAYGSARFANTLFGELRDTLFGRVTERAMRQLGLHGA